MADVAAKKPARDGAQTPPPAGGVRRPQVLYSRLQAFAVVVKGR
jgi:hypothetical protein